MDEQSILDITMRMKLHWWQKKKQQQAVYTLQYPANILQILDHLHIYNNKDVSVSQRVYNAGNKWKESEKLLLEEL